jgi:ELWxxDGT repeat protein
MRCWRPFSVVLALIAGGSASGLTQGEGEGGSTWVRDSRPWEPCERAAVALGAPLNAEDLELREPVHAGRGLFFAHNDGTTGLEPWLSTGTRGAGTLLVKDIHPGPGGSHPSDFTRVGSRIFFSAEEPGSGRELWVSDGTPEGTSLVKDIWPGATGSYPRSLFEYKGLLYFAAGTEEHGRELWRSDGTPEGTFLVEDVDRGPEGTAPDRLMRGGDGALYYLIDREGTFTVLMRGDGGPGAVELFRMATEGAILESLTAVGRRTFFVAGDVHEDTVDLMVTTGGAPVRVGRFTEIRDLVSMGGRLYFTASTQARNTPHGGGTGPHEEVADLELWRSDGTVKGTRRVKDIRPGTQGSSPHGFRVMGRQLFFTADDGTHGAELWVSNGTDSGTRLFADLESGAAGSFPRELTVLEGNLFFSAETAGRGREAWLTDGTLGETVALGEVAPGVGSSDPTRFVRAGWDAFFTARDEKGTLRLWALPLRPPGRCDTRAQ